MNNQGMHAAMRALQEASAVMAHIENTRSERFLDRSEKLRLQIEKNLAEITEIFNRLIR